MSKVSGIFVSIFCSFQKAMDFADLYSFNLAVQIAIYSWSNSLYLTDVVSINGGWFKNPGLRDWQLDTLQHRLGKVLINPSSLGA